MSASQLIANRFRINDLEKDLLGQGGMGAVYRATDTQTGELVAVKVLNAKNPGCTRTEQAIACAPEESPT